MTNSLLAAMRRTSSAGTVVGKEIPKSDEVRPRVTPRHAKAGALERCEPRIHARPCVPRSPRRADPGHVIPARRAAPVVSLQALNALAEKLCTSKKDARVMLKPDEVSNLIDWTVEELMAGPSHLELPAPIRIVGDIHGQVWTQPYLLA